MSKNIFMCIVIFFLAIHFSFSTPGIIPNREKISLSGTWAFALDTAGKGIQERWFDVRLAETVELPGTLDENKKGIINTNRAETMRLSKERTFEGIAWYQKKVKIDSSWKDKEIFLTLERTKPSKIWIDGNFAGESQFILTPQKFNITRFLTPGEHTITILINNGKGSVPDGLKGSHAWTEHTQTNWNGIIGEISVEATPKNYIQQIRVNPDPDKNSAEVLLTIINNEQEIFEAEIKLKADAWNTSARHNVSSKSFRISLNPGENQLQLTYPMGNHFQFWSEFSPALYKLNAELVTSTGSDNLQTNFGMRKFTTSGTQFQINGITTFLRGEHNACVFPLTGYPPMETRSWQNLFQIAKTYGINHYRFHSWTPPKAAFEAADIEGIYLQPELPYWGRLRNEDPTGLNEFLTSEGDNILNQYGSYASFVMFALGNELSGSLEQMQKMVNHFRKRDPQKLYALGSNNYLGTRGQVKGEDFYVGCRVGADTDTTFKTHTRASFSFADAYDGGYINGRYPSTDLNYAGAISKCTVPVIGHEIAQFQIYPDYREIEKYTGVLKPWNLEIFRKRIIEAGMADQAKDFTKASGAASMLCYRADIEMAIRTPGFGGFHLLDLQDFPGQGSALVGILDAFMDSKGLITPETFSQFCNRVVPLLIMEKYCWDNSETFRAQIQVANYSEKNLLNRKVTWQLTDDTNKRIAGGTVKAALHQGKISDVIAVSLPLSEIKTAQKLNLTISIHGTVYQNSYPVWVYPHLGKVILPQNIRIEKTISDEMLKKLAEGEKVLLIPDAADYKELTVGGLFTPDYWNYKMFKGISENNKKPVSPGTMGILTDPIHPLFKTFPTEFHSNWQWWPVIKNSHPFILDNAPLGYKPVVQVIDNIERNHKLGLIFEFAVGNGKLLVCMSNLETIQNKPEGKQLFKSITDYMNSTDFNPETKLTATELKTLFTAAVTKKTIKTIGNISYE